MKKTVYLNYFLSFLIYFAAISIAVAIASYVLSGGETFAHGVPIIRTFVAGYLAYSYRLRIKAEW